MDPQPTREHVPAPKYLDEIEEKTQKALSDCLSRASSSPVSKDVSDMIGTLMSVLAWVRDVRAGRC